MNSHCKAMFFILNNYWRLSIVCHHPCVSETRPFNNTILSDQRERSVVTLYTPHISVSETRNQLCVSS
jgi:hypothetical protein